jgi:hypothetical protein
MPQAVASMIVSRNEMGIASFGNSFFDTHYTTKSAAAQEREEILHNSSYFFTVKNN